jgi:hypothetical protein
MRDTREALFSFKIEWLPGWSGPKGPGEDDRLKISL